jgi:PAS domain-containing protein
MTVPLLSLAMDKREWLISMEAVLEALNEGDVITNENHRILFANSRFVEMTGIPKQDFRLNSTLHRNWISSRSRLTLPSEPVTTDMLLFSRERAVAGCQSLSVPGGWRIPEAILGS